MGNRKTNLVVLVTTVSIVVTAWLTAGDVFLRLIGCSSHTLTADGRLMYMMTTVGFATIWWLLTQISIFGVDSFARWQTYIGLLVACFGTVPLYHLLDLIKVLSVTAGGLTTIGYVFPSIFQTVLIITGKILICLYWWRSIGLESLKKLIQE